MIHTLLAISLSLSSAQVPAQKPAAAPAKPAVQAPAQKPAAAPVKKAADAMPAADKKVPSAAPSMGKPCDELKSEIAAKLDAKGVKGYTLDVVANDMVKDQTVVGSCGGGTSKITYKRG